MKPLKIANLASGPSLLELEFSMLSSTLNFGKILSGFNQTLIRGFEIVIHVMANPLSYDNYPNQLYDTLVWMMIT